MSGSLPTGLSLNPGTGQITGTPTASGEALFSVQAADAAGATDVVVLNININQLPSITTLSLPQATEDAEYNASLDVLGGIAPYTWEITVGALPDGLDLDSATGEITGTPTTAGEAGFTAEVTGAAGAADSKEFAITVNLPLVLITDSLSSQTLGVAYQASLEASGGTLPRTWEIIFGDLPAGLTLNTGTGDVTGTPLAAETQLIIVEVMDHAGATDSREMSITINAPPAIATVSLPDGAVNTEYSTIVEVSGGTAPYDWSSVGLPAGLAIDPITGEIAGISAAEAEAVEFTVEVMDSAGAVDEKLLAITINAGPEISTGGAGGAVGGGGDGDLPEGTVSIPYSVLLETRTETPILPKSSFS